MAIKHYDAVIVGARVAGAATALALASAGARVLILDRSPEIGDTLSTHALMRPAVELLARWGLLETLLRAGTPWVRQAHFHYGAERIAIPIKPDRRIEGLIAPRRWLLDRAILEAAVAAGAELALDTSYEDCVGGLTGRVCKVSLRGPGGLCRMVETDFLIGADGRTSRVAATVGAPTLATSQARTATAYTYVPGIPNEGYRWYFGEAVTAGVIPTTGGDSCVFAASRAEDYRALFAGGAIAGIAAVLGSFDPVLADHVRGSIVARARRFAGGPGFMRARIGTGWALVGDAAFFRDPVTAHGITDALLDADALSAALIGGRPAAYETMRHAQAAPLFEITQRIARLDWDFEALRSMHTVLNECIKSEQSALTAGQSFPPPATHDSPLSPRPAAMPM
jgi:flavin-dependent dehydrogenase